MNLGKNGTVTCRDRYWDLSSLRHKNGPGAGKLYITNELCKYDIGIVIRTRIVTLGNQVAGAHCISLVMIARS